MRGALNMHTRIKNFAGPMHPHPTHQEIQAHHSKLELIETLTLCSIEYAGRVLHHENPDSERITQVKKLYRASDREFRAKYGESFSAYQLRMAEQRSHRRPR